MGAKQAKIKKHQTIMLIIEKHITKMGIGSLCKLFGK
jgi:hypothetical protein